MLYSADQRLWVHHEGAVAGEGNRVLLRVRHARGGHRTSREAHVRGARLGVGLAGCVVLNGLEAIGLHVAGIEKLDGTDFLGEVTHELDCGRLCQHRALPDLVEHRRHGLALAQEALPRSFAGATAIQPYRACLRLFVRYRVQCGQQLRDHRADVALQRQRAVVMRQIRKIRVDVDDLFDQRVANTRTIALAYRTRANGQKQRGICHCVVATD